MNEQRSKTKQYITFKQAGKRLPSRPSRQTIWRWATKGIKAPDGSTVKMRHARFGGVMMTTPEWLDEFGQQLAEAHEPAPAKNKPRIPTKYEARRILAEM